MSNFTLTDAFVDLGGSDISSSVRQINFSLPVAPQDASSMGTDAVKRLNGLKDMSMELEFNQDFDAAALDSVLFPLWGTEFTVTIRPTSAVVGVNNPQYSGQAIMPNYTPLQGSVGDTATASVSLQGTGGVTRATA